jgi:hypothetical protein
MNDIDYQQVIKWVLIVLAAGFIGHFGKSFAEYLLARARKKKILASEEKSEVFVKQQTETKSSTEMTEKIRTDPKLQEIYMGRILLGRFAEPEELVPAFVFFASDDSRYVTGQLLIRKLAVVAPLGHRLLDPPLRFPQRRFCSGRPLGRRERTDRPESRVSQQ